MYLEQSSLSSLVIYLLAWLLAWLLGSPALNLSALADFVLLLSLLHFWLPGFS
jgi:hypothetical protein